MNDARERAGQQRDAAATLEAQLRQDLQLCRKRLLERTEQLLTLGDEASSLFEGGGRNSDGCGACANDGGSEAGAAGEELSRQLLVAAKEIHEQVKAERNLSRCVVCLEGERSVVLLPCRHAVLCTKCSGLVQQTSGRCPVCRAGITSTLSTFS